MNESAVAVAAPNGANVLEKVVIGGDLAKLSPVERVDYYSRVCDSLGLNPLTRPFDYIVLNGRLTLYANRTAGDQLRSLRGISITRLEREMTGDVYVVTAYGTDKTGRSDSALGAVPVAGLRGEALANAFMKAETKAKRRLTLSLAGLGWSDETEIASIPNAEPVAAEAVETTVTRTEAVRNRLEARAASRHGETTEATPEPAICGDEDASPMALGLCDKPADHKGAHGNPNGTWPR